MTFYYNSYPIVSLARSLPRNTKLHEPRQRHNFLPNRAFLACINSAHGSSPMDVIRRGRRHGINRIHHYPLKTTVPCVWPSRPVSRSLLVYRRPQDFRNMCSFVRPQRQSERIRLYSLSLATEFENLHRHRCERIERGMERGSSRKRSCNEIPISFSTESPGRISTSRESGVVRKGSAHLFENRMVT